MATVRVMAQSCWSRQVANQRKWGCAMAALSHLVGEGLSSSDSPGCCMGVVSQTVSCKECGTQLDESASTPPEQRISCPSCGSTARVHHVQIRDTVTMHGSLGLKARHGQSGRPFVETRVGDDL